MTTFTIHVKLDIKQDAQNYRSACNKNTHSTQRKDQITQITSINLSQLQGMNLKNAYSFLRTYLISFWEKHKEEANKKIADMQNDFDRYADDIFTRMEKLTQHPMYRNDFTIFLTSLNRGPYNIDRGQTWSYLYRNGIRTAFIHELLHFQTIYYYKPYILQQLGDENKFEDLKESLTFLLNHEFKDIIEVPDHGYPQHQVLREQLEHYRVTSDKNFSKLITYGCSILLKL